MEEETQKPHRSIQDIIPPARSKPIREPRRPEPMGPSMLPPTPPTPPTPPQPIDMNPNRPRGIGAFLMVAVLIVIALAAILGIITTFFHRATVEVTPQRYTANVDVTLESSPTDPSLPYERVTAEETLTKTVSASGSRHVENHASGTITVYNALSTSAMRLITNTRFESKEGKVYYVHTPITVPGYTMKAGIKVPGSLDVTVYAGEAGEGYNVGLTEFTLPGLTDPEEHELVYARSKTPMEGGFVGNQAVVDPNVRGDAIQTLKTELDTALRAKILAQVPGNHVVFPGTVSIVFTEKTDAVEGNDAVVGVSGVALAPAFPAQSFAGALAQAGNIFAESALSVENPSEVSVRLTTPDAIGGDTPLSVSVSGAVRLVAAFDHESLARDLAGKDRDAVQTVLPGYPGIADITVKIYPLWRSSIPANADDIKVEVRPDGVDREG